MSVVLFNINHNSGLLPIIYYRYIFHKHDDCYLLVPHALNEETHKVNVNLQENKIFTAVVEYKNIIGMRIDGEQEVLDAIDKEIRGAIARCNIQCNNIDKAVSFSDANDSFAIWAAIKEINLYLFEPGLDSFSNYDRYETPYNYGMMTKAYYNLQKKYHVLCGESGQYPLIRFSTSKKNGDQYFDVVNSYKSIDSQILKQIVKCFDTSLSKNDFVNSQVIILNSPGYILLALSHIYPELTNEEYISDNYERIYCVLLDYFNSCKKTYYVKQHPYSNTFDIDVIKDAKLLGKFPIEILNLIKGIEIENLFDVDSTSYSKIPNIVKSHTQLGSRILNYYHFIHQLMFCFKLAEDLRFNCVSYNLPLINNADLSFLSPTKRFKIIPLEEKCDESVAYIISEKHEMISSSDLKEGDLIVFFDANELSKKFENDSRMQRFTISVYDENSLVANNHIYFATNSNKLLDKCVNIMYIRELSISGLKIIIQFDHKHFLKRKIESAKSMNNLDAIVGLARLYRDSPHYKDIYLSEYWMGRARQLCINKYDKEWAILVYATLDIKNSVEAFSIFEKEYAINKDYLSLGYMGLMKMYGVGTKRDPTLGKQWIEEAYQHNQKWLSNYVK